MPKSRADPQRTPNRAFGAVPLPAIILSALKPRTATAQPAAVTQDATSLPELNVNAGPPSGHGPVRGYAAGASATATESGTPLIATATEDCGIAGAPPPTRPERGTTAVGVPSLLGSLWANRGFQRDTALEGLSHGVRYAGSSWGDTAATPEVPDNALMDPLARDNLGKPGAANTESQLNLGNLSDTEYISACNTCAWCWYGFPRNVLATFRHRF